MKYISEYRSKKLVKRLAGAIEKIMPEREIRFMEVCGTHTHNFLRFGLDKLIPDNLKLVSGPGCPVCVSDQEYIDKAILYAKARDHIVVSFGDMLRVPGTSSSLEKEIACGAQVKMLYSALDSLKVARENPQKKIIFLAVGFETTAPTIALSILAAKRQGIKNIFFFSSLKLIPPAMRQLVSGRRLDLQGFLCPGHVSVVIGIRPYAFIARRFKIGCCITGFEPVDILQGLYLLLSQVRKNQPCVENQYSRVVRVEGNPQARKLVARVFKVADADWRGLGRIAQSGLSLKASFADFDAEVRLKLDYRPAAAHGQLARCKCAEVLKGLIEPRDCPLFAQVCTPYHPLGPCMVSQEGSCNAYFRYKV